MSTVLIHFQGPYALCDPTLGLLGDCPISDCKGLYLQTVRQREGGHKVTYVGMTERTFYERAKQHAIQELGGNYRVLDPDAASRGAAVVLWNGLWRKDHRREFHLFLDRYAALAPLIKRSLLSASVFVAASEHGVRTVSRIEAAIARRLLDDPNASSLMPHDIRYRGRRGDEDALAVVATSSGQIHGFPMELEV